MAEQGTTGTHMPGTPGPASPASGSSRRGIWIALLALVVVAGVVIAGIVPRMRTTAALKTETNNLAVPTVSVIHPKRGAPQQEVVLPGNIQAFTDSPIYARTNGYLKAWYTDIGAHVKKGQLLAEIDTPEVDQQLQQARADLNTSQANLNLSQITTQRYEALKDTDSVAKQDVDNAAGDFQAKKAMLQSAQHNVQRLEELLSFRRIYAPFDGIITARNTDVGDLIDSGSSTPAKELFHIAAIQRLRVYVNVPQVYSRAAKPGLTADLTLAEFPGRRFQGMLVRTANSIDTASRTLLVEVDVNNPGGELLPGAYTEVHLKIPEGASTFILPVNALVFQSQGLQAAQVDSNNHVVLLPVTPGRDFGTEIEIVAGLTGQENIIVNPPDSLIPGETVRIVSTGGSQ
jgi:RND family efflux transporter MFP subunit